MLQSPVPAVSEGRRDLLPSGDRDRTVKCVWSMSATGPAGGDTGAP